MAARHPGRLELIEQTPILLLDGAHNPEGAAALATAIRDAYPSKPLVLLTAMMSNKDASGVAAQLAPLADRVIATQVDEAGGVLRGKGPSGFRSQSRPVPGSGALPPEWGTFGGWVLVFAPRVGAWVRKEKEACASFLISMGADVCFSGGAYPSIYG